MRGYVVSVVAGAAVFYAVVGRYFWAFWELANSCDWGPDAACDWANFVTIASAGPVVSVTVGTALAVVLRMASCPAARETGVVTALLMACLASPVYPPYDHLGELPVVIGRTPHDWPWAVYSATASWLPSIAILVAGRWIGLRWHCRRHSRSGIPAPTSVGRSGSYPGSSARSMGPGLPTAVMGGVVGLLAGALVPTTSHWFDFGGPPCDSALTCILGAANWAAIEMFGGLLLPLAAGLGAAAALRSTRHLAALETGLAVMVAVFVVRSVTGAEQLGALLPDADAAATLLIAALLMVLARGIGLAVHQSRRAIGGAPSPVARKPQ